MIYIEKETEKFAGCQSCLTDKNLNVIKIRYSNSTCYHSITLCDNCIQQLVDLHQKKEKKND